MNKIFKVIFSKAKGIFVVTGENAKAQGKSKHLKAVAASVVIASTLGITGNIEAADLCIDGTCTLPSSITDSATIDKLNTQFASSQNTTIQGASNNSIFTTTPNISPDTVLLDGAGHSAIFIGSKNQNILKDYRNKENSSISFQNFDTLTFSSNTSIFNISAAPEASDWNTTNPTPFSVTNTYKIDIGQANHWINTVNFTQDDPSTYFIYFHDDVLPTVGGSEWNNQLDAGNEKVTLSGKKDIAFNIYAKNVNFGSENARGMYGITSNNHGINDITTQNLTSGSKINIVSEKTSIYTIGSSIAQADISISAHDNQGTSKIILDSYDITIGGGNVALDADEVIVRATYKDNVPDYGKNNNGQTLSPTSSNLYQSTRVAAIQYAGGSDSSLNITAARATIETIDQDGNTAKGVMAIQAAAGLTRDSDGKINITTTEQLTVNGDVGYSQSNLYRERYSNDKQAEISLTAAGGNMDINGDIRTYNSAEAGKENHLEINLNASNNASINTNGDIKEDCSATLISGVNVNLDNSSWNIGGADNNIKSLTADKATINLGSNKAAINDYLSGSKGATITMDGSKSEQLTLNNSSGSGTTLIETNGTTENQLVLKNNTADIRLKLSKTASDRIGDQLQTVADMVDLSENTGDNAKGIIAALTEGDIIGARTLQINATGQITQVTEQKNRVMESLKDIGLNNWGCIR